MKRGTGSVTGSASSVGHSVLDVDVAEVVVAAEARSATIEDSGRGSPVVSAERAILERLLSERLTKALSARGLGNREVRQPNLGILVPAAEAMRFAPGQQEIANLIASAMDPRFSSAVLPSHVDVLKQLTLDELALLRATPPYGFSWVVSDLVYILVSGQVLVSYRNISPSQFAAACATPSNVPQYIDNLTRLHLVYSTGEDAQSEEVRRSTARIPFVRKLIGRRPAGSQAGFQSRAMRLTDFGEQLRRACLY